MSNRRENPISEIPSLTHPRGMETYIKPCNPDAESNNSLENSASNVVNNGNSERESDGEDKSEFQKSDTKEEAEMKFELNTTIDNTDDSVSGCNMPDFFDSRSISVGSCVDCFKRPCFCGLEGAPSNTLHDNEQSRDGDDDGGDDENNQSNTENESKEANQDLNKNVKHKCEVGVKCKGPFQQKPINEAHSASKDVITHNTDNDYERNPACDTNHRDGNQEGTEYNEEPTNDDMNESEPEPVTDSKADNNESHCDAIYSDDQREGTEYIEESTNDDINESEPDPVTDSKADNNDSHSDTGDETPRDTNDFFDMPDGIFRSMRKVGRSLVCGGKGKLLDEDDDVHTPFTPLETRVNTGATNEKTGRSTRNKPKKRSNSYEVPSIKPGMAESGHPAHAPTNTNQPHRHSIAKPILNPLYQRQSSKWQLPEGHVSAYLGMGAERLVDRMFVQNPLYEHRHATEPARPRDTVHINHTPQKHVVSVPAYRKLDEDTYNFNYPNRGYMVVIVNNRFRSQSPRDGAECDLRNIRSIGHKLGFKIFNKHNEQNLTKAETIDLLNRARWADHSQSDCFAFLISSHGLEQANPLADGRKDHALVCADDQMIFTSFITDMFSDKNCPTLKGKPKFFFIQACRGEGLDSGSDIYLTPSHGTDKTCAATETGKSMRHPSVDEQDTRSRGDTWAQREGIVTQPHLDHQTGSYPMSSSHATHHGHLETGAHGAANDELLAPGAHNITHHTSSVTHESELLRHNQSSSRHYTSKAYAELTETGSAHAFSNSIEQLQLQPQHPHHEVHAFSPGGAILDQPTHPKQTTLYRRQHTHGKEEGYRHVPGTTPYAIVEAPSLKCDNDQLVMFAIPPGMFAWRNTVDGSWMISYLHQVIEHYDMNRPKNFLSVLTKVTNQMARRTTNTPSSQRLHGKKAVSVLEYKLTKDVFFRHKSHAHDSSNQHLRHMAL